MLGEANAIKAKAEAKSVSLKLVAESLKNNFGQNAASLSVAEQYVKAFSELAKTNNTLILSSDANDTAKMVSQVRSNFLKT